MVLANFPPSSSPILDSHRINAWFERTNGRSVGRSVVRSVGYRAKNCCGSRGAHDFLSLFPKVNEGERSVEKRRAFLPRKCPRLRRIDEPFLSRGLLSFSLSRLSPCVESPRRSLTVSLSLSFSYVAYIRIDQTGTTHRCFPCLAFAKIERGDRRRVEHALVDGASK